MITDVHVNGVRFVPDVPRDKTMQSIGGFVAKYRTTMGLKQKQAGEMMGLPPVRLHRIEAGYEPTLSEAVILADFYGFAVEELAKRARK